MGAGHRLGRKIAHRAPGPLRLVGGRGGVVVLAEHLDISPQREGADAVFGFAPLEAGELEPAHIKAEEKLLALHSAGLGHEKVPQLMDKDHKSQPPGHLQNHPPARRLHQPRRPRTGSQQHARCRETVHRDHSHHQTHAHLTTSCLAHASSRRTSSSAGSD